MTTQVVVVCAQTPFKEVVRALDHDRISGVPVIDGDGVLVGRRRALQPVRADPESVGDTGVQHLYACLADRAGGRSGPRRPSCRV